jgi:hypothetical protein
MWFVIMIGLPDPSEADTAQGNIKTKDEAVARAKLCEGPFLRSKSADPNTAV